jgi:hypothetical protein
MSTFKKYYDNPDYRIRHISRQKKKIICPDCNAIISRSSYYIHRKSNKHLNNLKHNSELISDLERERTNIERIYNKKIRAMKRKQNYEIEKIHNRLLILNY